LCEFTQFDFANELVPEDDGVDLLVADPALILASGALGDDLPLAFAGHILFMAKNSGYDQWSFIMINILSYS